MFEAYVWKMRTENVISTARPDRIGLIMYLERHKSEPTTRQIAALYAYKHIMPLYAPDGPMSVL